MTDEKTPRGGGNGGSAGGFAARWGSYPDPAAELAWDRPRVGLGDPVLSGEFIERVAARRGQWVRSLGFCAVLVSLVAVLAAVIGANQLRNTAWNDSYRYVTTLERYLGKDPAQAQAAALQFYCGELTRTSHSNLSAARQTQITSACVRYWTKRGGLAPNEPRFNLIFSTRPGYPMMAVPFVKVFGLNRGLAVLSVLIALAAGWGIVVLIRVAGGGSRAALAGIAACFTFPTWYWLGQFLTEPPTLVFTIGVLIGAVLMLRGATKAGLIVSVVCYTAGFLVRYSNFSMLSLSMLITLGVLAMTTPYWRNRRVALLSGFTGAGFLVMFLLPYALGWPGFHASLQDTFTNHYTTPAPPNMYGKLLALNYHYWIATTKLMVDAPLVPVLVVAGAILLWRYRRAFGAVVGAAALTGLGTAAAHPLTSQLDRLYFLVYLLAVCGLPIVADLFWPPAGPDPGEKIAEPDNADLLSA